MYTKLGDQAYVDGPTAACPFCGLGVHIRIAGRGCEKMGGCVHLTAIERIGKRIVIAYADDPEE